jgi:hypothetical protein
VILFNHGDIDFPIKKGDRVAQLILERISMASVQEVEVLSETERGASGFGSTGIQQKSIDTSTSLTSTPMIEADENNKDYNKRNKTETV